MPLFLKLRNLNVTSIAWAILLAIWCFESDILRNDGVLIGAIIFFFLEMFLAAATIVVIAIFTKKDEMLNFNVISSRRLKAIIVIPAVFVFVLLFVFALILMPLPINALNLLAIAVNIVKLTIIIVIPIWFAGISLLISGQKNYAKYLENCIEKLLLPPSEPTIPPAMPTDQFETNIG